MEVLDLSLRDPFRIARHMPDRLATTVLLDVTAEGLSGVGEAFPVAYYGETAGTVRSVVPLLAAALESLGVPPGTIGEARTWLIRAAEVMDRAIGNNGAAKCGMDIALHDAVARSMDLPLHELLGTPTAVRPTDFSIGIDEPAVVAERASRMAHFPALKIKVGGPADLETLEAVRAVYGGPLRVDANTGWHPEAGLRLLPELERLGVELIEQPFRARAIAEMRWLQERSALPIVADESAVTIDDLPALVGAVAGVNVKLGKCGGVGPALRMIERARELGFKVFLGCMEETSLGIAAAAVLAGLVDWVDLDGNLLLADDPFVGLELDAQCRWRLPAAAGVGVRRVAHRHEGLFAAVDKSVDEMVDGTGSAG
ncbi:MAG: dipeptide epimerase [Chloroflexi bacterium]|nr:dipeptide epimerase [Chloroflexota bacterium]